ncbi:MAG: glycosyltransferase family 9 protein [Vampirovibrionales bacterium]
MKLLLVRLSAHGDILQTLPVLASIKAQYPTLQVGWLVETEGATLLSDHPLIDTLHVIPRKTWLRDLRRGRVLPVLKSVMQTIQGIRQEDYTIALDIQGLFKSAVWAWLMCIPYRLGFKASREYASLFYTHTVKPHDLADAHTPTYQVFLRVWEGVHAIPQLSSRLHPYLADVPDEGALPATPPTLYPFPQADTHEKASLELILKQQQWRSDAPMIAMAPATKWQTKCWPDSYWATLVTLLQKHVPEFYCIFVGTATDAETFSQCHDAIVYHPRGITMAGKTSLRSVFPLLEFATLFLGGDSFALHASHIVQHQQQLSHRPVLHSVGLWGPTSALRTGPILSQHHTPLQHHPSLACQPCFKKVCPFSETHAPEAHHACMKGITPEEVLKHVLHQLTQGKA